MRALTAGQALRLHQASIERFGGEAGIRDMGLLESALARPFAAFEGVEAHPEIHEKAAALLHGLAINHLFVDGNKRVALAAMLVFLRLNGYRLALTQLQRYELTVQVAQGSLTTAGLAQLLRDVVR